MTHVRTDVRDGVAVQARKRYGRVTIGSRRLNLASDNVLGTFAQLRDEYDRLRRIDERSLISPTIVSILGIRSHRF
jgi:hypothetical protein